MVGVFGRTTVLGIAALLASGPAWGEDFQIVLAGSCPGIEILTVAGASPSGFLELYRGAAKGDGVVPAGSCKGTPLGLADPELVSAAMADPSGRFTLVVSVPTEICEGLLQAVDLTTCAAGNVGRLETGYPASPVRTGQKVTFDDRDDGELRPGVAWPEPRFTDEGDGTVTDNLTGLVWLGDAGCLGDLDWEGALAAAQGLESDLCGLVDGSQPGDWRLPNLNELLSLVDFGEVAPALTAGHPFSGVNQSEYWSSSTSARVADAWWVNLLQGNDFRGSKSLLQFVWPVRGES